MVRTIHDDACFVQYDMEFESEQEAQDIRDQMPEGWHYEGECGE